MAKWHDISTEIWRTYHYGNGVEVSIEAPLSLAVKRREDGMDSHRIIAQIGENRKAWYIAPGWLAIEWAVKDNSPPFVDSLVDGPFE